MRNYNKEGVKSKLYKKSFCQFCGTNQNLTIDHIIPKALGGTDAFFNLQLLCKRCNEEKLGKVIYHPDLERILQLYFKKGKYIKIKKIYPAKVNYYK